MKYYSLVSSIVDGSATYKLIDNSGQSVAAFDCFSQSLKRRHARKTRKGYCEQVARFFDYLAECESLLGGHVQREDIREAVESFPEWLLLGESSGNEFVKKISKTYPSPKLSGSTVNLAMASIKVFMELSERIRQEINEKVAHGSLNVDPIPLWEDMSSTHLLTLKEKTLLIKKSMIAGVVSGGPRLTKEWLLPKTLQVDAAQFDKDKSFPFDKAISLIESFLNARDRALYAFCAASGCRIHEALQLLWTDIDVKDRSVALVNPSTRKNHSSYLALLPKERDALSWKGRTSSQTLLIQPFKDLFFENLETYLRQEYIDHKKHDFVFQYNKNGLPGVPYFLSSESNRAQTFRRALNKIGVEADYGAHSLRHMYGTYLVNYFPNSKGGAGLPLEIVQKLLAHSNIASTQKYAKIDIDLISAELYSAASASQTAKSALEIKRELLLKSLSDIEEKLASSGREGLIK